MNTILKLTTTDLIALTALLISLVLAYIKVRDYIRDNRGIHVSYAISGRPGTWNIIYLTNLSVVPIVVEHWEITWRSTRYWFLKRYDREPLHDDDDLHFNLTPHKTHKLEFKDQYEFNWHPKNKDNVDLMIKLQIAGRRKPLHLLVYKSR